MAEGGGLADQDSVADDIQNSGEMIIDTTVKKGGMSQESQGSSAG